MGVRGVSGMKTAGRMLVERARPDGVAGPGGGAARSVRINLAESPLGWLAARGLISARQQAAGEQLRDDWARAGLAPRVTMRWDATPGGALRGGRAPGAGHGATTLAGIDAKRRFDAALAQAGPGLGDILWRVACAGEGVADAETALGWPKRSAKLVLGFALDRVADYYRIP